ncbi:MAG: tetratricopeptide repeat protein [Pyrinomonadaceae bacterium]
MTSRTSGGAKTTESPAPNPGPSKPDTDAGVNPANVLDLNGTTWQVQGKDNGKPWAEVFVFKPGGRFQYEKYGADGSSSISAGTWRLLGQNIFATLLGADGNPVGTARAELNAGCLVGALTLQGLSEWRFMMETESVLNGCKEEREAARKTDEAARKTEEARLEAEHKAEEARLEAERRSEEAKRLELEKTFAKDSVSLFYLGQIAVAKNDLDGAIAALNRATVSDARFAAAWTLLTPVYLRRAALSTDTAKSSADYLNAVRAGEGLIKVRTDAEAVTLFGQALIGSQQYARAAAALERATLEPLAKAVTFYLLGIAQSRAKNFPKAIAALETAASKSPDDINVYRELGYAYEVTKQYAKALGVYQKGLVLAPADTDFKKAAERVRPFAK